MMLEDFKSLSRRQGAVLLGVCGGRNSEGEDYPGDYINSVIIVGIPYHMSTPSVNAKIKYNGYENFFTPKDNNQIKNDRLYQLIQEIEEFIEEKYNFSLSYSVSP